MMRRVLPPARPRVMGFQALAGRAARPVVMPRKCVGRDCPHSGLLTASSVTKLEKPRGSISSADGTNIIRGLIARGYSDDDIRKIAGLNALDFFKRTIG